MTYVYFIQQGYGNIKVGVADDPDARCKELQTGNPKPLRVIARFPMPDRDSAFEFERHLHAKFYYLRLEGEWFRRRLLKELMFGKQRLIAGTAKNPIDRCATVGPKLLNGRKFWRAPKSQRDDRVVADRYISYKRY